MSLVGVTLTEDEEAFKNLLVPIILSSRTGVEDVKTSALEHKPDDWTDDKYNTFVETWYNALLTGVVN